MKKYIIAAIPLLTNNEIMSLLVLCVIAVMFIGDLFGWMEEGKW